MRLQSMDRKVVRSHNLKWTKSAWESLSCPCSSKESWNKNTLNHSKLKDSNLNIGKNWKIKREKLNKILLWWSSCKSKRTYCWRAFRHIPCSSKRCSNSMTRSSPENLVTILLAGLTILFRELQEQDWAQRWRWYSSKMLQDNSIIK